MTDALSGYCSAMSSTGRSLTQGSPGLKPAYKRCFLYLEVNQGDTKHVTDGFFARGMPADFLTDTSQMNTVKL